MPRGPIQRRPYSAGATPLPTAFACPQCGVHAQQKWLGNIRGNAGLEKRYLTDLRASICAACGRYSIWIGGKLTYPRLSTAPEPIPVMPDEVRADYEEAREVFDFSPRAAAALLRLSIQKLCVHLGCPGKKLDDDIALLVAKGLPAHVQMALDAVRVVGNNSVHPGELYVRDDTETARSLFDCVNWIVDAMIHRPRRIAETYAKLPPGAREAVARRDSRSAGSR
jgi:hypothetical protein